MCPRFIQGAAQILPPVRRQRAEVIILGQKPLGAFLDAGGKELMNFLRVLNCAACVVDIVLVDRHLIGQLFKDLFLDEHHAGAACPDLERLIDGHRHFWLVVPG